MSTTPFADTRFAQYIDQRIGELHHKTQAEIAREAGFRNANFITMLKTGASKLALDRVPALFLAPAGMNRYPSTATMPPSRVPRARRDRSCLAGGCPCRVGPP